MRWHSSGQKAVVTPALRRGSGDCRFGVVGVGQHVDVGERDVDDDRKVSGDGKKPYELGLVPPCRLVASDPERDEHERDEHGVCAKPNHVSASLGPRYRGSCGLCGPLYRFVGSPAHVKSPCIVNSTLPTSQLTVLLAFGRRFCNHASPRPAGPGAGPGPGRFRGLSEAVRGCPAVDKLFDRPATSTTPGRGSRAPTR